MSSGKPIDVLGLGAVAVDDFIFVDPGGQAGIPSLAAVEKFLKQ